MGDKGELGVKNLKKLVTSLMNGPKQCGWTPPFYTFSDKKKPFRPIHKYTYYITNLAVGIKKNMLALFLEVEHMQNVL